MTAPGSAAAGPVTAAQLTIVPANQASWADLQAIFGTADYPGMCYCQRFKTRDCHWSSLSDVERRGRLREQTHCDDPRAAVTTGLVAYLGAEPAGWVAVEPRTAYPRLLRSRTVWSGRQEDRADDSVWAVTCFVTRKGYRKRGITYALAAAAADFARDNGATALEAYPMITTPGKEVTWGELHVGSRQVFADAGFTEVSRPSPRRVVVRIDFARRAAAPRLRAVGQRLGISGIEPASRPGLWSRRGGGGPRWPAKCRPWSRGRADDMPITAALARARASAVVTCLVLAGSATGALGADASAAVPMPSASALLGVSRSVPRPGSSSQLFGISCTSPGNCWAVGRDTVNGADLNQALHWNGRRWSQVPAPNPGGTTMGNRNELNGVFCASPADCWAVGDFFRMRSAELNQALHWNGRRWSLVPVPSPGGTASVAGNFLTTVRCISPASCWAVGDYRPPGNSGSLLNQALHWNGRNWSMVRTPVLGRTASGAYDFLSGVRCTSAGNCWAVGGFVPGAAIGRAAILNQILHWNGRKWSQVSAPDPGSTGAGAINVLDGVACTSSGNCWAAGAYGPPVHPAVNMNQALHWNGRKWSLVATPDPGGTAGGAGNELLDVTCTSPASCWAVGDYGNRNISGRSLLNQALHWNGHTWSLIPTPDPGGMASGAANFLNGIRCPSPASCWAVGDSQASGQLEMNQALHWNGHRWSAG